MLRRSITLASTIVLLCIVAGTLANRAESSAPLRFRDVAAERGITVDMRCGGPEKRWIMEANGSGAAWLDFDNDGWMDLLIVNGGNMDQLRRTLSGQVPAAAAGSVFLYRNQGDGTFQDVTAKAGLVCPFWGTGANAADYDNDGYTDILLTTIGSDMLFHNNGNGTFTDVSRKAGLRQSTAWHTGSAFGDFDGDGLLDLFISGYVDIHSLSLQDPAPVCANFGQQTFCGPIGLKGERPIFYRNRGDGAFEDATVSSGLANINPAHGFSAATGDFNGDGKLDVFVANDSDPNQLFLNQGGGVFKESALNAGVAYNADGRVQSNMGVAIGDYLGHNGTDVMTTTFSNDYFPLFHRGSAKDNGFEDVSTAVGLASITSRFLGWACGLSDFENRGANDFWTANGHVYPTDKNYRQPIAVFRNRNGKSSLVYSYPDSPTDSYRGGAAADFDNDGRMDLLVLPIAGRPVLLKNESSGDNTWVGFRLQGAAGNNRDAIGATATVAACDSTQSAAVRSGTSYLSRNDPRLHFGLGHCRKIDRVEIRWPNGKVESRTDIPINRYSVVAEAK